jgi:predicted dehydrogenase
MQPLRAVVLGTSFGGAVHVEGYRRHPGFELVGLAGTNAERTRRVAEVAHVPLAETDWQRLLDATRPDVVSIVTPVDLHHPMTLAALERGCHVICEKPTALHRHQAAEMRDRAVAAERVLAINHEFRMFPARRRALELVGEGTIGAPRRGEILGRHATWARPDSRPMNWLSERRRGGGILGALGSHHTDCLRTFFGEPESVLASLRIGQPRRGPTRDDPRQGIATADDGFTMHLTFTGGVTGLVDVDATTPYRWERFEIHGDEATLRWDETGYRLWRIMPGVEPEELEIPEHLRLAPRQGDPALLAPFGALLERFHAAIRDRLPMAPDFGDAVAVQSVLDAARCSSESGARVAIEVPRAARPLSAQLG